eukprot:UN31230
MTLNDLRVSKVGKVVNKLRKHENKTITDLAKKLVSKWKPLVKQRAMPPPKSTSKKAMAELSQMTGNKTRDAVRAALVKGLKPEEGDEDEEYRNHQTLGYEIEDLLWEDCKDDRIYRQRFRDLIFNIRDKNNEQLNVNLLTGFISPARFIKMTAEELASDSMKLDRKASRDWEAQAARSDLNKATA